MALSSSARARQQVAAALTANRYLDEVLDAGSAGLGFRAQPLAHPDPCVLITPHVADLILHLGLALARRPLCVMLC